MNMQVVREKQKFEHKMILLTIIVCGLYFEEEGFQLYKTEDPRAVLFVVTSGQ